MHKGYFEPRLSLIHWAIPDERDSLTKSIKLLSRGSGDKSFLKLIFVRKKIFATSLEIL